MSDINENNDIGTAESGAKEAHSSAELSYSCCDSSGSDSPARQAISQPAKNRKRRKTEKRKFEPGESRLKRLRPFYNNDYRKLFNETLNEIVEGAPVEDAGLILPKQVGVTGWSSDELEEFFTVLARKGRHELPAIATAIGTKTELEVHVFIQLLQNATVEQHMESPRHDLFENSDIPAALEIGKDCSSALELTADALSVLQQEVENKLERNKYGELWRLDWRTSHWIDQAQSEKEDGNVKPLEALPAAELLNLGSFLELSENLFMNSNAAEDNWRSYCGGKIPVSIIYTAFSDIHRLAISVTKRLVQSSLFMAMSRIKNRNKNLEQCVQPTDIRAALNVLGMKHNSRNFWIQTARRCNLAVYHKPGRGKQLSYDEVEERLSRDWKRQSKRGEQPGKWDGLIIERSTSTSETSLPSPEAGSDDHSISDEMHPGAIDTAASFDAESSSLFSLDEQSNSLDDHCNSSVSQGGGSSDGSQDTAEKEDLDLYVETLDSVASHREEKRLWKLIGRQPPENVVSPEELDLIKRPQPERRTGDDLDDWRAWTEYAPEWETYETRIPAHGFNGLKGKGDIGAGVSSHSYASVGADSKESTDFDSDEREDSDE